MQHTKSDYTFIHPALLELKKKDFSFEQLKQLLLQQLKKKGIKYNESDYRYQNNKAFSDFDRIYLFDAHDNIIRASHFIEKYIIPKQVYNDANFNNSPQDSLIHKSLLRKDTGGLVKQISTLLGINLDTYATNSAAKEIITWLYDYKKSTESYLKSRLKNPSIENLARPIHGIETTKCGEFTDFFKSKATLEMNPAEVATIRNQLEIITIDWQNQGTWIFGSLFGAENPAIAHSLKLLKCLLQILCDTLPQFKQDDTNTSFYLFYLKLVQFEKKGLLHDETMLLKNKLSSNHSPINCQAIKEFDRIFLKDKDIDFFLESNKDILIPFLYNKESSDQNTLKKYRKACSKVKAFLLIYDNHHAKSIFGPLHKANIKASNISENNDTNAPVFAYIIIAFLYELTHPENETIIPSFYGHNASTMLSMKSVLDRHDKRSIKHSKDQPPIIYNFAWILDVMCRMYNFLNAGESLQDVLGILLLLLQLEEKVLSYNSLDIIVSLHNVCMTWISIFYKLCHIPSFYQEDTNCKIDHFHAYHILMHNVWIGDDCSREDIEKKTNNLFSKTADDMHDKSINICCDNKRQNYRLWTKNSIHPSYVVSKVAVNYRYLTLADFSHKLPVSHSEFINSFLLL